MSTSLTEIELAARWAMSPKTLQRWRSTHRGPEYLKLGKKIQYPLTAIEDYENQIRTNIAFAGAEEILLFLQHAGQADLNQIRAACLGGKKSGTHLSDRHPTCCQRKAIDDFRTLMTLSITSRDSDEIEIGDDTEQLTPEVLFVDLINNLEKTSALVNAALDQACSKLEQLPAFLASKRALAARYIEFLNDSELRPIVEPEGCRSNYWLNGVICQDGEQRDALLKSTNEAGVMTRPIWTLMTRLPLYTNALRGPLDNAEWLEARVVNLPSSVPPHAVNV